MLERYSTITNNSAMVIIALAMSAFILYHILMILLAISHRSIKYKEIFNDWCAPILFFIFICMFCIPIMILGQHENLLRKRQIEIYYNNLEQSMYYQENRYKQFQKDKEKDMLEKTEPSKEEPETID